MGGPTWNFGVGLTYPCHGTDHGPSAPFATPMMVWSQNLVLLLEATEHFFFKVDNKHNTYSNSLYTKSVGLHGVYRW